MMSKMKILFVLLFFLASGVLYAQTEKEKALIEKGLLKFQETSPDREIAPTLVSVNPSKAVKKSAFKKAVRSHKNKAQWDILYSFNVHAAGEQAVETDGQYIYTTKWGAGNNLFFKYDLQGNFLDSFSIAGATSVRDLAYDGQYFYGSTNATSIYQIDMNSHTLVSTISTPVVTRHLCYDPTADGGNGGFWCGPWDGMVLVSRTGTQLSTLTTGLTGVYGSAFDNVSAGGPYLWLFNQDATEPKVDIVKVEIATGTIVETHDASDVPGMDPAALAGGMASSETLVPGKFVLLCNAQQDPNFVFIYEIANTAAAGAPAVATNFVVTPGANGALSAVLTWTNPSTTTNGAALTSLTGVKIYRDGDSIYTLTGVTIGGTATWTDNSVTAGNHVYMVKGYNADGDGSAANANAWVGPDVPAAPTAVELTAAGNDGQITWVAPTTGLHNGYFTGVTGYKIVRNPGAVVVEANFNGTTYLDTTISAPGMYSYTITSLNASGEGGSTTSNEVLLHSEGMVLMANGTVTVSEGTFYDSGGPTSPYAASENYVMTFMPPTKGGKMTFVFNTFAVESGYDKLYVYDGPDETASQIAGSPFSGLTVPAALALVRSSHETGALTFKFTSDNSVQKDGWDATISVFNPASVPGCTNYTNPINGATSINPNAVLQWAVEPNATEYDVYLGTTLPTTPTATVSAPQYVAAMAPNTTYHFKVVPKNAIGLATGCQEITFTTGDAVESFEAGKIPDGWKVYNLDGDGKQWKASNTGTGAHTGTWVVNVGYNSSGNNDWLVLPRLKPTAEKHTFSFWAKSGSSYFLEDMNVVLSTTDTVPESFTVQLGTYTAMANSWTEFTFDLTPYINQEVYVAIVCVSVDQSTLNVDDVTAPILYLDNDMKAVAVAGNATPTVGEEQIYQVVVKNAGMLPQSNYTVNLFKDGTLVASQAGTELTPQATGSFDFPVTFDVEGNATLLGQVVFAGDQDTSNNKTAPFAVNVQASGTVVVSVGTGATLNPMPLDFYWKNSLSEEIYYSTELNIGGLLTGIFYHTSFATGLMQKPVKIWVGETQSANLADGWIPSTELTLVFDGVIDFPAGEHDIFIPFTAPFIYTGGNLVVLANRPMDSQYFANCKFKSTECSTADARSRLAASDSQTYDPANPPAAASSQIKAYFPNTSFMFNTEGLGALEGYVTVGTDSVADVEVSIAGTQIKTFTDENGHYIFPYLFAGTREVVASLYGYYDATATVTIVGDITVQQNFTLTSLPRITVSGHAALSDIPNVMVTNVAVEIMGYDTVAIDTTDANGYFEFTNLYGGQEYFVAAEYLPGGYQIFEDTIVVGASNYDMGTILIPEQTRPPKRLTAVDNVTNARLTWWNPNSVSSVEQWIHWDDGANYSSIGTGAAADFDVAARYTPEDLTTLGVEQGQYLTKIKIFVREAASTYSARVWVGGDATAPGTMVVDQPLNITAADTGIWYEVLLTSPVEIDPTQELWVGYNINTTGGHPAGIDATTMGGGTVDGKGNMIYFQGAWSTVYALAQIEGNWNIQGFVANDAKGEAKVFLNKYNVYRVKNDTIVEALATNVTDTFYTDNTWAAATFGVYKYEVKAVYTNNVLSDPAVSNELPRGMNVPVAVTITSNVGGVVAGAKVVLVNQTNPSLKYEGVSNASGVANIDSVWRGTYDIKVSHPLHESLADTIEVDNDVNNFSVVLIEKIVPPSNVNVVTNPSAAIINWNRPGAISGYQEEFNSLPDWTYSTPSKFSVVDGKLTVTGVGSTTREDAYPADAIFGDFTLEFEVTKAAGSETGSHGAFIRSNGSVVPASCTGYRINLTADGSYGVWKYTGGSPVAIQGWTTANYLNAGIGASNVVTVNAVGSHFDIYFNGQLEFSFDDADHAEGNITLLMYDSDPADVATFDYYHVSEGAKLAKAKTPKHSFRQQLKGDENQCFTTLNRRNNVPVKGLLYGTNNSKPVVAYSISRGLVENGSVNTWNEVALVTDTFHTDYTFVSLPQGTYKYAVKSLYMNGQLSDPAISNEVYCNMFAAVTLNVTTNGGDAQGAVVTLTNVDGNPEHEYIATAPASGIVIFNEIWKGTYNLTVTKTGFQTYTQNGIAVQNATITLNANLLEVLAPVVNLQAQVIDRNVNLSWMLGGGASATWMKWCAEEYNTGIGGGQSPFGFDFAAAFEPSDLTAHNGKLLKKVKFYPTDPTATYSVKIWQGADSTLLFEQPIATFDTGTWNEIELTTPVTIDASQLLLIGFSCSAVPYPAAVDAGPALVGKGDLLNDGTGWYFLSGFGLDYNWMIQGMVDYGKEMKVLSHNKAVTGYDVYIDNMTSPVANVKTQNYSATNLSLGTHTAGVKAVYASGASQMTTITFEIPNQNPSFSSTPVTEVYATRPYSYNVTATDPDAGQTLTITKTAAPEWLTLTDNGNGTAKLRGTTATPGTYNVTLTVSDGIATATQTFAINVLVVPNVAPAITSTPVETGNLGAAYLYEIIVTDPDTATTITVNGTIPTWASITKVDNYNFRLEGTPDAEETFDVTLVATDGVETDSQTFQIVVGPALNENPTFTSEPVLAGTVGVEYTYEVVAIDVDGDVLAFTAEKPNWLELAEGANNGEALLSGTPTEKGNFDVTLVVSDGNGGADTQIFVITVATAPINNKPEFVFPVPVPDTLEIVQDSIYNVPFGVMDADNDDLTLSLGVTYSWLTLTNLSDTTALLTANTAGLQEGTIYPVIVSVTDGKDTTTKAFSVKILKKDAVNSLDAAKVSVYPNPTADVVKVSVKGINNYTIFVRDLNGKLVATKLANNELSTLDLSALPSGTYLITVKEGNKTYTQQIIVK